LLVEGKEKKKGKEKKNKKEPQRSGTFMWPETRQRKRKKNFNRGRKGKISTDNPLDLLFPLQRRGGRRREAKKDAALLLCE